MAMRLVTREQLKAELDAGEPVKLVMTAGAWQVRAKHIPGTLKLLTPELALRELRPDDRIVVYTVNQDLVSSEVAWEKLTAHGYRDVRRYVGGLQDWEAAGYAVEGEHIAAQAARRWPGGHSPRGHELHGACPHCDQGWSGAGWPAPPGIDRPRAPAPQAAMTNGEHPGEALTRPARIGARGDEPVTMRERPAGTLRRDARPTARPGK
jgi:rhodanese-related sulfurtransferase